MTHGVVAPGVGRVLALLVDGAGERDELARGLHVAQVLVEPDRDGVGPVGAVPRGEERVLVDLGPGAAPAGPQLVVGLDAVAVRVVPGVGDHEADVGVLAAAAVARVVRIRIVASSFRSGGASWHRRP